MYIQSPLPRRIPPRLNYFKKTAASEASSTGPMWCVLMHIGMYLCVCICPMHSYTFYTPIHSYVMYSYTPLHSCAIICTPMHSCTSYTLIHSYTYLYTLHPYTLLYILVHPYTLMQSYALLCTPMHSYRLYTLIQSCTFSLIVMHSYTFLYTLLLAPYTILTPPIIGPT